MTTPQQRLSSGKGVTKSTPTAYPVPYYQRYTDKTMPAKGPAAPGGYQQYWQTYPYFTDQKKKPDVTAPSDKITFPTPESMKFNLPPHSWSLPVDTTKTSSATYNVQNIRTNHAHRRARMWYYGGAAATANNLGSSTPTTGSQTSNTATPRDNYWGFQFLWNPEDFTTVTTRNANVVPSSLDKFSWSTGLFSAMEGIQFTIVIDRTNDFACIRGASGSMSYSGIIAKYYAGNSYPYTPVNGDKPVTAEDKLETLARLGTMADVEYIFKMINGSGQTDAKGNSNVWANALGRETADLAFLSPVAIALQLGPTSDSLSYVGWIESLTVKHERFTQDMVPIHSTVTVNLNAFSRIALQSAGN